MTAAHGSRHNDPLSADDLRSVLRILGELHAARDPDELTYLLMQQLNSVVNTDLISYNDIDLSGTGSTHTYFEPELVPRPELERAFAALQHQHPLVRDYARNGDPSSRRMSDFIELPRLRSLDLWHEVFRPLETNYQVGLVVALSEQRLAGIGLNRWQQDFSDRDLAVTDLLQEHLPAAYDHARLRARLAGAADPRISALTPREHEVLALLSTGRTNQQIARALRIHPRTVDKHTENVRTKLGVRSRTEAAAVYLRGAAGSGAGLPLPRKPDGTG